MSASTMTRLTDTRGTDNTVRTHPVCAIKVSKCFTLSYKQRSQLSSAAYFSEPRISQKDCVDPAVYSVRIDGKEVVMCNMHFNEYFETHEIGADMVMRLSDNEEDFVHNGRYYKDRSNNKTSSEPLCRVPKPIPMHYKSKSRSR